MASPAVHMLAFDAVGYRARSLERRADRSAETATNASRLLNSAPAARLAEARAAVERLRADVEELVESTGPAAADRVRHMESSLVDLERRVARAEASVRRAHRRLEFSTEQLSTEGGTAREGVATMLDLAVMGSPFALGPRGAGEHTRRAAIAARAEDLAVSAAARVVSGSEARGPSALEASCRRAVASASAFRDSAASQAGSTRSAVAELGRQVDALGAAADAVGRSTEAAATEEAAAAAEAAAHRAETARERASRVLGSEVPGSKGVRGEGEAADEALLRWGQVRHSAEGAADTARRMLHA